MCPELFEGEEMVYPHEHKNYVTREAHFQRVWSHYRDHIFKIAYIQLVENGDISAEEDAAFRKFIDPSNPNLNIYIMSEYGVIEGMENDDGINATRTVLEKMGLDQVTVNLDTAQPWEE